MWILFIILELPQNRNIVLTGEKGNFTSYDYPGPYPSNLNYSLEIKVRTGAKIYIHFHKFDLEDQKDCLYDYLHVVLSEDKTVKMCGNIKK